MIAFATSQSGTRAGLGVVLCVLAALSYSVAVIFQKPVLQRVSAFQRVFLASVAAMVACLPFTPTLVSEAGDADTSVIAWVVYLGVVPTALGFATWAFALNRTSAGRMDRRPT